MDYNLLKTLTALVSTSNVTQAAKQLHLSQPAASNALARLRQTMQDPILVRSGNTMIATERAINAAKEAQVLMDKIEQLFTPCEQFDPITSHHRFTLALTDYGMQTVVPSLLQALTQAAPNIELDFRLLNDKDTQRSVTSALINNEIDFLIAPIIQTPKAFNSLHLFDDHFVTIASRQHARVGQSLSIERFLDEKHILVSFSGDRDGLVDTTLKKQGQKRTIAHTVNNFYNAALMVEKTELLCTVSQKVAKNLNDKFDIQTVKCPIPLSPLSIGLHWSRVQETKPEHAWFISLLKSTAL